MQVGLRPGRVFVHRTGRRHHFLHYQVSVSLPNTLSATLTVGYSLPPMYSISGTAGTAGVTITAGGKSAVTDATGTYRIVGLHAGTYSVSASKPECRPSQTHTVTLGPDAHGIDFTLSCGSFVGTASMRRPRMGHRAVLMLDGRVIVVGGQDEHGTSIRETEIFDPNSETWTQTENSLEARLEHTATLLEDGRVLVVGGVSSYWSCSSNASAEIFDPATESWTRTSNLPAPVGTGHVATRTLDG